MNIEQFKIRFGIIQIAGCAACSLSNARPKRNESAQFTETYSQVCVCNLWLIKPSYRGTQFRSVIAPVPDPNSSVPAHSHAQPKHKHMRVRTDNVVYNGRSRIRAYLTDTTRPSCACALALALWRTWQTVLIGRQGLCVFRCCFLVFVGLTSHPFGRWAISYVVCWHDRKYTAGVRYNPNICIIHFGKRRASKYGCNIVSRLGISASHRRQIKMWLVLVAWRGTGRRDGGQVKCKTGNRSTKWAHSSWCWRIDRSGWRFFGCNCNNWFY